MNIRFGSKTFRVIDLTHSLIPGQEQYGLELKQRNPREGETGDIMNDVLMWSHVGTHLEVPLHFYAHGKDTAALPLEIFMGPAVRLDFRAWTVDQPITLEEFQLAAANVGGIGLGEHVIMWQGCEDRFRTPHSHDRPFVTEEALEWLLSDRKVRCLGTDSSGFEVRGKKGHPNHTRFFREDATVLECLRGLGEIQNPHFTLLALPLPVRGLDACPVRALALEEVDAVTPEVA
jgi:arylformamidase